MRKLQFHSCGNFRESYQDELTLFRTDFGRLWVWIGLIFLFAVIPFSSGIHTLKLFNLIGIYAIAALGLNILTGFTGQLSVAHGALFGIGAYTAAILASKGGFPFFATIPIAAVFAAAAGIILSFPAARLRPLYLCIATLGGQLIIEHVLLHWKGVTGGAEGFIVKTGEPAPLHISHGTTFYFVVFVSLALMIWIAANLMRTKFGRAFAAIKNNEATAEGMGIPVFKYKLLSFAVSSFCAGFAGALFAYHMGKISPGLFSIGMSMEFVAMIVAGGLGSIPGAVFGSICIVSLDEFLALFAAFTKIGGIAEIELIREFFYGSLIIVFITLKPKGIAAFWQSTKSFFSRWPL